MKYDQVALGSLRGLSLDIITKAKSGHPGMALSAAPLLYTLFTRHMVADPENPTWINRDRFVLSAGHGSALLYALLHLAGYHIPMDQLKQFRQLGSLTPGHPEFGHTPGVDASAGPLGQGIAQAVGMAVAENHLAAIYPEGDRLINHYTYCLTGDGCLEEGISQEAISLAGIYKLNKLILLYDKNDCTLDGPLSNSSIENVEMRFNAAGWNVLYVKDGNDIEEIDKAITLAKTAKDKPTIIICHTVIGFGSSLAGSNKSHGAPFSEEEVIRTKERLGVAFPAFEVPGEAYLAFKDTFIKRGKVKHSLYVNEMEEYKKVHMDEYNLFISNEGNDVSYRIFNNAPKYEDGFKDATRNTSQAFLNVLAGELNNLMGGSADVAGSVKTNVKSFTTYGPDNRAGQNMNFGIREFAMASLQNGMLLHGGLRTYIGSFLVFADYMKGAIRMACMEKIPAVYLFSHDSLAVGEDGPTHQPIEQITMLRTIPGMSLFRPADAVETAAAYHAAFASTDKPTAIILSRQALPNSPHADYEGALRGGYVVSDASKKAQGLVIATGSEVSLVLEAQKILLSEGIDIKVVSMPSIDTFESQDEDYKKEVIDVPYDKRVFVEMGKSDALYKYAHTVIGIDEFGTSAPAKDALRAFHFTPEEIAETIKKAIR